MPIIILKFINPYMKYLKIFNTIAERQSFTEKIVHVSYTIEDQHVNFYKNMPFFCKLTLNNDEVIEIKGSGTITSEQTMQYQETTVQIEIGKLCTCIGSEAFYSFTEVTSVTIPNSVTSIGELAFNYCISLTNVTIPNSVTSIGDFAFVNCSNLTDVTIPNSVTSIGEYAFNACGLTSLYIPSSVISIGEAAFINCGDLLSINVDSNNTVFDSRNNCNALIETSTNTIMYGCRNTIIQNTITTIGYGAFQACKGLTSLVIPNNITSIQDYAFYFCQSISSLTIGSGLTNIGHHTFERCTSLTSITSLATTAPTIQNDTFNNIKPDGTLYVPSGSSGYDIWMGTGNYYLGQYRWTKIEQ